MSGEKKLNLSALNKKSVEDDIKTPKISINKSDIGKIKINIPKPNIAKKTEVTKNTQTVIKKEKSEKPEIKIPKTSTNKPKISISKISNTKKESVEKKEIKIEKPKIKKEEKEKIVTTKNSKVIEEKKEINIEKNKRKEKTEIKEEEIGDFFGNYESEFEGKENIIFENIKNIKKTHPKFLAFLIILTVLIILGLFKFSPERHSIERYRNDMIDVINGIQGNIKKPGELEFIKLDGFDIPVEKIITKDGNTIYKYNESIFEEFSEVEKIIQEDIEEIKEANIEKEEKEIKRIVTDKLMEKYKIKKDTLN